MLLFFYILAIIAGGFSAFTYNSFKGGEIDLDHISSLRRAIGILDGISVTSLLVYPFLVFSWYVGVVVFLAIGTIIPVVFHVISRRFISNDELLGYLAIIKPYLDFITIAITAYLWGSYFYL